MINIKYDLNTINYKRNIIKTKLFEISDNINSTDFTKIADIDLYKLFYLYDEVFLNYWFKNNFKGKLKFKLSRQLTSSAGNTKTSEKIAVIKPEEIEFEVKVSLNHLANFHKTNRVKSVGGIEVKNKLDSLMLVFEHEVCHVIEFIVRKKSSCSQTPFKDLIYNLFGQSESTHKLVTIKEANYVEYGFKPGDKVNFIFEGKKLNGFINKINKRAVVMCPDILGNFIDMQGNHYKKYYVPLNCLTKYTKEK